MNEQWIICPTCHSKTRLKILETTELKNFPLFCPKCKTRTLINVKQFQISTSFSEKYLQEITERRPHPLFPIHIGRSIQYVRNYDFELSHSIFQEQSRIIREVADKSSCVIVGRCAEYVLKEYNPFRIFTYADLESKIQRCKEKGSEQEDFTEKEWKRQIMNVDKQRAKYYSFYTGQTWGEKTNYDLCINTTAFSIKKLSLHLSELLMQSD